MNFKKLYLTMTIASLSVSPLIILASCSSTSYVTLIPKITETKVAQIQEEIANETAQSWIDERRTWTKDQWLVADYPLTGYISGGNVIAKNISNIKVNIFEDKISFVIELDKNSSNRFLDNKTEWTAFIPQVASQNN
ncbi:MAG: hypothetical protein ACRCXE_02190 [Metamycoplasmataceae bacterium]